MMKDANQMKRFKGDMMSCVCSLIFSFFIINIFLLLFRLKERTFSLWGHLSKLTNDFLHPFYKEEFDIHRTIKPITTPHSVRY